MKIAITGKGGVGKTFISGTLACQYASTGHTTIAIDADTSPNLGLTLGMTESDLDKIIPIAENTSIIEEKTKTDYPGVFKLVFTVDDIITNQSVQTPCGVSLLVMGTVKSMGSGCACPANSVIRNLIGHMITETDEIIIMDMEAGIEHLGRGTAEHVDVMLIVTDAHQASLLTAERIARLAREGGIPRIALVANRVRGEESFTHISNMAISLHVPLAAVIPYDEEIVSAGVRGISPVYCNTPATQAISNLLYWIEGALES
ncbi:AAA family ATPase [Methanospirillum purgamenti]|jgi:CO dehydrogenase maturation factor|uniref:AAA family ATPase n=1 Tax=Methanospirillum hungatei TaxID=2203 RepID=A0A8F5ZG38_METHU|nr:ArsA-related P-loop ATPase [Methanospirillum hungatei]QXO95214.1 AAA family ATPase [Methanospirillum hungatei]